MKYMLIMRSTTEAQEAFEDVDFNEVIAQMGASGDSLFPHLHYELRNGIGARAVEGLPSYFNNFRRLLGSGAVVVRKGQVDTGDIVDSIESVKTDRQ